MKFLLISSALLLGSFLCCEAEKVSQDNRTTLECVYEYHWVKDTSARMSADGRLLSGDSTALKTETMILKCGGPVSLFYSYNSYVNDSIIAENIGQGNYFFDFSALKNATKERIYKHSVNGETIMTDEIGGNNFRVTEDTPDFGWKLSDEWKEIAGYKVRKASCSFRGREWTVWFAPDIPLSDGPWKFSGLPGLIFEAGDKACQYHYILAGIKQKADTVGIPDINFVDTDLRKFYRTMRRFLEDPVGYISSTMSGNITVTSKNGTKVSSDDLIKKLKYDFKEIL